MKVAIVCGGGIVSGKEIMVLQLADGLREAGINVEVVSSHWSDGKFALRLEALGIPTHKVWFGFISATLTPRCVYMTLAQLVKWPQLLAGYASFLRRFKPDKVIHTNWHSLLMIALFVKRPRDTYWVHEVMPDKEQYRKVFGWFAKRLQQFVAVSNAVAGSLVQIGIPANKIEVIYNGVDRSTYTADASSRSDGGMKIGIVGQIGAWKGHEDLLQAFQLVVKGHDNCRLNVYGRGDPDYEASLRQKATELGIADKVTWPGFVNDQNDIYANVELIVVPSRSDDALPTVAIEAALAGIPVIASSRGGLPEIIEDGVTGFLFDAGNTDQLARHIIRLLTDRELRIAMGQNSVERAKRLFSHDRFVRQFCDILKQGNSSRAVS